MSNDDMFYEEIEPEKPPVKEDQPSGYNNPYDPNSSNNPYRNPYTQNPDNPYGQPYGPGGYGHYNQPPSQSDPLAIIALISGIVSLLCCCCPYAAPLCGIVGVTLPIMSKKGQPMKPMSIVALVISIIGLVLSLSFLAYYIYVMTHPAFYQEIMQMYQEMLQEMEQQPGVQPSVPGAFISLFIK